MSNKNTLTQWYMIVNVECDEMQLGQLGVGKEKYLILK